MSLTDKILQAILSARPVDWLEGLGLNQDIVRPMLLSRNQAPLAWAFERLSFDGAPRLFTDRLKDLVQRGDVEFLRTVEKHIKETEWRQILTELPLYDALKNGPPAMLDWLETKGVGAGFWQKNLEKVVLPCVNVRHLSSIEWLLQKNVTFSDLAAEIVCCQCIVENKVDVLCQLKKSGAVIKPIELLMYVLISIERADTIRIADVLEFSLGDLQPRQLGVALMCGHPNVLKWLAKERITPQTCVSVGSAALARALGEERIYYLDWLWEVGVSPDVFILGAAARTSRESHPKLHAWLQAKIIY